MIRENKQGAEDAKANHSRENFWGFMNFFPNVFWHFSNQKLSKKE